MAQDNVFGIRENKCMVEVLPKSNTYSKAEVYNKTEVYNKNETYSKEETFTFQEVNTIVANAVGNAILPVGAIVLTQVGASSEWFNSNGYLNMGNIVVKNQETQGDEVFTLWRKVISRPVG